VDLVELDGHLLKLQGLEAAVVVRVEVLRILEQGLRVQMVEQQMVQAVREEVV
jgi:hypothetical protein